LLPRLLRTAMRDILFFGCHINDFSALVIVICPIAMAVTVTDLKFDMHAPGMVPI